MLKKINPVKILWLCVLCVGGLSSCATAKNKYYKDTQSFMYGMIYDADGTPVQDVAVLLNDQLAVFSDVQGRFILTFNLPAKIKNNNNNYYTLTLQKNTYETITEKVFYDPMGLLHFQMRSLENMLQQAEHSIDLQDYKTAQNLLEQAQKIAPHEPTLRYLFIVLFTQMHEYSKALNIVQSFTSNPNPNPYLLKTLDKITQKINP